MMALAGVRVTAITGYRQSRNALVGGLFYFGFHAERLEMVSEDLKTQQGENPDKNRKRC